MSDLPGYIKIKSKVEYRILESSEGTSEVGEDRGEQYDSMREIVVIKNSTQRMYAALLHELIHAMSDEWEIGLTENQTQLLEMAFVNVFGLNPTFACELVETLCRVKVGPYNRDAKRFLK